MRGRKYLERLIRISDRLECSIEESLSETTDVKNYKELTAAVREALAIRRNLFGLPTQPEKEAQRLAREKLELERVKNAGDNVSEQLSLLVEFSEPELSE